MAQIFLLRAYFFSISLLCVVTTHVNTLPNNSELNLSPNARVHLRNDPGYTPAIKRWQYWKAPDFSAVIDVATESDVAAVVRFANVHHIPFLAQSGGHGGTSALGELKDGVQIRLSRLNIVQISEDGMYATIGGGIKGVELRDALWKHGKWTVTGMCECPGHVTVALGGGIGILQGKYGLASDQIIAMNVVLANGTAIRVSNHENKDLFWAMRGAGHNFGIVTSMDVRIYDVPGDEEGKVWSHEVLTYEATGENVRDVFGVGKDMLEAGSQPDGLMIMGFIGSSQTHKGKIVITLHIVYDSPLPALQLITKPYQGLLPLSASTQQGAYLDIPRWFGIHDTSIACSPEQVMPTPACLRFPVNSRTYNLDALIVVVEEFSKFVKANSDVAGSTIMIEQWPTHGVRERSKEHGAVPWREHMVLIAPALVYSRDATNSKLDEVAWVAGKNMQKILVEGAIRMGGHYAYVNYASGGEGVDEIYGEKNMKRLRELKGLYDPDDKFRYYAPIGVERAQRRRDEL